MKRIEIGNTKFEGQNNVYLLDSGGDAALTDTGFASPDVRRQIVTRLADLNLDLNDIEAIIVTHWHHDHAALYLRT